MNESDQLYENGDVVAGLYRVDGVLGEGGMGIVYRATQLNLDRPVALKVLLPEYMDHRTAAERFEREARVAATLHHRNAVEIYDFGADEQGRLYIAMEHLRGDTLFKEIPTLALPRALDISLQITDVLIAAHKLHLVHRDLKPDNIFLERGSTTKERVVVVDFGLAFIPDQEGMMRMTQDGIFVGTPAYLSPEQARGREITPAADVYSLGCMLYEMVTSVVPFWADNAVDYTAHHLYSIPKPMRENCFGPPPPQELDDLVLAMLAKQPGDRPVAQVVHDRLAAIHARLEDLDRPEAEPPLPSRAERMVSSASPAATTPTLTGQNTAAGGSETTPLAIAGQIEESLALGLRANGLMPFSLAPQSAAVEVVYAPNASLDQLRELHAGGVALVADTDPSDLFRVSNLLRVGVNEVVSRPVQPDELARKVFRALRRRRRTRSQ